MDEYGTRTVTVRFTDYHDPRSLASGAEFAQWIRERLEGMRDISVEYIRVEDNPKPTIWVEGDA